MNRDCDLVAVPWVENPSDEFEMIKALSVVLTGKSVDAKEHYLFSVLPAGRHSYVIDLNRGGYKKNEQGEVSDPIEFIPDPEYYIDISVTPKL